MSRTADDMGEDTIVGVVTRDGSGRRTFNILIGLAIAASVLAVVIVALRPYILPYSLVERAHAIEPGLPSDAVVVKVVEKGRDAGDIWFTLTEAPGLEGQSLVSIWSSTGHSYRWGYVPAPSSVKVVSAAPAKTAPAVKKVKVTAAPTPTKIKAPPVPAILRDGDTYLTYDKTTKRYHLHVDNPY